MGYESCRKRDKILSALGLNARQRRQARELTQEKLAEKSGLDPTYTSDIERGLRNAGINNVAKLVKALGLTTAELCKGVDACGGNQARIKTGKGQSLVTSSPTREAQWVLTP